MKVLSRVLKNAVAGVVVVAGVGSLFTLGIMYGVKVAYAEPASERLDAGVQYVAVAGIRQSPDRLLSLH